MTEKCRPSEVAGSFYEDDKELLIESIQKYFDSVDDKIIFNALKQIKSLELVMSPHAGYVYSGHVAAYSYKLLFEFLKLKYQTGKQDKNYKVLILAPIHTFYHKGLCQVNCNCYFTPIGKINSILLNDKNISKIDFDYSEHSLEVQLPFLQYVFKRLNSNFSIIPIYVGEFSEKDIDKYAKVIGDIDCDFIILSSDLSHFLSYEHAKTKDNLTINTILNNGNNNYYAIDACGIYPIMILKQLSKIKSWKSKLLNYANSGDIKNTDKKKVVGYGSIIFYK